MILAGDSSSRELFMKINVVIIRYHVPLVPGSTPSPGEGPRRERGMCTI